MTPRTSTVLRTRWGVRVALRLAAAGLATLFAWRVVSQAGIYWTGGYKSPLADFLRFGLLRNVGPLGAAALLVLMDLLAVPWLAPAGRWACPRCGYSLDDVREGRCPECGQRLSDEVAGAAGPAPARPASRET